jgi:hypothetical protein
MKNWDGMYPPHPCKKCGKMLNADGGHPAELYAGCSSYTGLCDKCARGPAYVEYVDPLDGAITWNCPPSQYGDRERRTYIAYANCEDCKGTGRTRFHGRYESFDTYCKRCLDQQCAHPLHQAHYKATSAIFPRYEEIFKAECKSFGIRSLGTKKKPLTDDELSLGMAIQEWLYPQYAQEVQDQQDVWALCLYVARSIAPPLAAI